MTALILLLNKNVAIHLFRVWYCHVLFCVGFGAVMFSCVNVRGLVLSRFGSVFFRFDVVMFSCVNVRGLVLSRFGSVLCWV